MTKIPITLIYSRLILGFAVILLSLLHIAHYKFFAITFLTIGLLTDIFDGIIARKLKISTQVLRRLDSTADQVFFISIALAAYIQYPDFFRNNILKLSILFGIEVLAYLISFLKFRKEIATHSIGAKIWALLLFATLAEVILSGEPIMLFQICFWAGILTRLEIIAIILILKNWTNDVPTVYHSLQLRQGKGIKRNKMLNG